MLDKYNQGFHKMHNIGNNGINANFVLIYICSFLLHLHQMGFANVKFNINGFWSYVFWSCHLYWSCTFLMTEPKNKWQYCHSCIVESLWKLESWLTCTSKCSCFHSLNSHFLFTLDNSCSITFITVIVFISFVCTGRTALFLRSLVREARTSVTRRL